LDRVEECYGYLDTLNDFISNDNEVWLNCLRTHGPKGIKVVCAVHVKCFAEQPPRPTIYIRFEKGVATALDPGHSDGLDMYAKAYMVLFVCGIRNIEEYKNLDFVVGEETGKSTRPCADCDYLLPTYDQIHVSGES
jgi:hypothetical protein